MRFISGDFFLIIFLIIILIIILVIELFFIFDLLLFGDVN